MCEEPQQHNMYTTAACDVGAVCSVYISPAQRQYMLITLQLLAVSVCGWRRGAYIHNFNISTLKIVAGG